jgi:hypothetical protein
MTQLVTAGPPSPDQRGLVHADHVRRHRQLDASLTPPAGRAAQGLGGDGQEPDEHVRPDGPSVSLATVCRRLAALVGVAPADVWIGNPDLTALEIVAWVQEAQQAVATALRLEHAHRAQRGCPLRQVPAWWRCRCRPMWRASSPTACCSTRPRVLPGRSRTGMAASACGGPRGGQARPSRWHTDPTGVRRAVQPAALATYVIRCPDYATTRGDRARGRRARARALFESCIQYSALAAYRDSKGLPAATAGAQAAAMRSPTPRAGTSRSARSASRGGTGRRHGFAMGRNPQFVLDSSQSI